MRTRILSTSRIVLGLAVSAWMAWLVTRGLEWHLVIGSLRGISIPLIFGSVVIFLMAGYVRAIRWQLLFVKKEVSTTRLFIIQNEGIGLNNVIPVRVASEATQVAILSMRERVAAPTAVATLGIERVIDLMASTLIMATSVLLIPQMKGISQFVWAAVAVTVASIVLIRLLSWGSAGLDFVRRIQFLAALMDALRDLESRRLRLLASLLVSILYWLLIGVTAWFIAVAISLPISPLTSTLVIMGTIFFSTVVPAAPSALGIFEWAILYVLSFFGIPKESGLGFALVAHAVFFVPPSIIAAIYLPREGLGVMAKLRGLVFSRSSVAETSGTQAGAT